MDQQREDEILLNVALGLDPLTAVVAADDKPGKKPTDCLGCLLAAGLLLLLGLLCR